jgi:hypothetical protein
MKSFLAKYGAVETSHPPCSPDIALADSFCAQRKRFQDAEDIMRNTTVEMNAVPVDVFGDSSQELLKRCTKFIELDTDYFEQEQNNSEFPVFFISHHCGNFTATPRLCR